MAFTARPCHLISSIPISPRTSLPFLVLLSLLVGLPVPLSAFSHSEAGVPFDPPLSFPGEGGATSRAAGAQFDWGAAFDAAEREGSEFSRDDVEYIRNVLELANLKGSVIGDIIKHGSVPELSVASLIAALRPENIAAVLLAQLNEEGIARELTNANRLGADEASPPEPDNPPSRPGEAPMAEAQAAPTPRDRSYERCKFDYDGFVKPITNRLLNAVRGILCAERPTLCSLLPNVTAPPMPGWGWIFFDAHGKIPEGIAEGKLHFVGGHDECHATEVKWEVTDENGVNETREFGGKYCRLSLTPEEFFESRNISLRLSLLYGVCVPDHCTKEQVRYYINHNPVLRVVLNRVLNVNITKVYCGQELDRSTDGAFWAGFTIMLILFILTLLGTVYDSFFRIGFIRRHCAEQLAAVAAGGSTEQLREYYSTKIRCIHRVDLFFVAFSLYTNLKKVFSTADEPGHIRVFNGLRYLTFVWVILGHTYLFGPAYQESVVSSNTISAALTLPRQFLFQFVLNYHFNVDTYLLMSGLLVTWHWLRWFEGVEGGPPGVPRPYTLKVMYHQCTRHINRRYWRIMPPVMLTLMFYTCFYRYFIEGPLYPSDIADAENCRHTWWNVMLMGSNMFMKDEICVSWTFAMIINFQLNLFGLIVLVSLVLKPKFGYFNLVVHIIGQIGINIGLSYRIRSHLSEDALAIATDYLITPWCRAGPYYVGMAYGLLLHRTQLRIRIPRLINLLLWFVSIAIMMTVLFASYDQLREGGHYWPLANHVAFDSLARPAWAAAVGYIVVACATGHGGIIARFLEWNLFKPLGRIVYPALLVASLMIFRYPYANRVLLYVDQFHMFYLFLGHLIYCFITGLFFGLLWYFSVSLGVEKMITCSTMGEWAASGRCPEEMEPQKRAKIE